MKNGDYITCKKDLYIEHLASNNIQRFYKNGGYKFTWYDDLKVRIKSFDFGSESVIKKGQKCRIHWINSYMHTYYRKNKEISVDDKFYFISELPIAIPELMLSKFFKTPNDERRDKLQKLNTEREDKIK